MLFQTELQKPFNENDNVIWLKSISCVDRGCWLTFENSDHYSRLVLVVSRDWDPKKHKNKVLLDVPLRIGEPLRCPQQFPKDKTVFYEPCDSRFNRAHEMILEAARLLGDPRR
jgi:hypothetical protein